AESRETRSLRAILRLLARPNRTCPIVTGMDFAMSTKAIDYHKRLSDFMTEYVFPAEADYDKYRHEAGPNDHTVPPIIEDLKIKAKQQGLWNLFLPAES